jgi:hypothetical protein
MGAPALRSDSATFAALNDAGGALAAHLLREHAAKALASLTL